MLPLRYTPFSKPIQDLDAGDLDVLRSVSEGWHVEYKQEVPTIASIAKSISAFANHHGGWLFYGVVEDKQEGTADSFPGVSLGSLASCETKIREAAAKHISPPPYFTLQVLRGPSTVVSLNSGRVVICIAVPPGRDAPYLHSTGKIYRRVGSSSEPKAETDKTTLDLLWQRSQAYRDRLARFVLETPTLSEGESDNSFLHVYLLGSPLNPVATTELEFGEFAKIMREPAGPGFAVEYENAFTMARGFVARHVGTNDPVLQNLTWRYFGGGNSVVSIPLRAVAMTDRTSTFLGGYEQGESFHRELQKRHVSSGQVVDLNSLFSILMDVSRKQRQLMAIAGASFPLAAKLYFEGIWRRIPFWDSASYLDFITNHGVPVVQDDEALAPPGVGPESFDMLEEDPSTDKTEPSHREQLKQISDAARLVGLAFGAMGVPSQVLTSKLTDLQLTAERAIEVMRVQSR